MQSNNPYWPFNSEEEKRANDELRTKGYAILRDAHDQFREAVKKNGYTSRASTSTF